MNRKISNCLVRAGALSFLLGAGFVHGQQTASIGGNIYSGANDGAGPVFHPSPLILPILDAQVLVQDQHTGDFIVYGSMTGNSWTASVPAPGDYVVMFAAPGHDATSRGFNVPLGLPAPMLRDAYLPPLFKNIDGTPSPDALPLANLLYYAFFDNKINGQDDWPIDPALNGVTVRVYDKNGVLLQTRVTGTQTIGNGPDQIPPGIFVEPGQPADPGGFVDPSGLYYFRGLPPGELRVEADPSTAYLYDTNGPTPFPVHNPATGADLDFNALTEFYNLTTEEGGHAWEVVLYPGDPGTEAGAYLIWNGFVEKLGQPPVGGGTGIIRGQMIDSDMAFDVIEPADGLVPQQHPGVSANTEMPDGFVVLYNINAQPSFHALATTEADPVTGHFEFQNVPPGRYAMFCVDKPLDYVFQEEQGLNIVAGDVIDRLILVPRFFGRVQGFVYDNSTADPLAVPPVPPTPMAGATVNIRFEDGSIQYTTTTDATGWYNFDDMPEIEVLAYVDVSPPAGYRGAMVTDTFYPDVVYIPDPNCPPTDPACVNLGTPIEVTHNAINRYVQWFTANYRADLYLEPVPAMESHISGSVFGDNVDMATSVSDGLYDQSKERSIHGATVELWNAADTALLASTTTGQFDRSATMAQGWNPGGALPLDEWGGVFAGPMVGYYEFRTADYDGDPLTPPTPLVPGTYNVKTYPNNPLYGLNGYAPTTTPRVLVTLAGGEAAKADFGVNNTPPGAMVAIPRAGAIEGGVFDDINLDLNPNSLLFMEKQGLPGTPVGIYDHLGYLIGVGRMGHPWCFAGATDCPLGEAPLQSPEMEGMFAPGPHIYLGNDPLQTGYMPSMIPMPLAYTFRQGQHKFEADWSLIPTSMGGGLLANGFMQAPVHTPPVINWVSEGRGFMLVGENFGDLKRHSTVTFNGELLVTSLWSDTLILAEAPTTVEAGAIIVTTDEGISNGKMLNVGAPAPANTIYVDGQSAGGNGSPGAPYPTITEALASLTLGPQWEIHVAPGWYQERIQILVPNVRLIGSGPQETVIDGLTPFTMTYDGFTHTIGSVITIGSGTNGVGNVMISGFTIRGGATDIAASSLGAGIFGTGNANLDINNCIIEHNAGLNGGGIWLHNSNHNVRIWSNTIRNNGTTAGYGGGISVSDLPLSATGPGLVDPPYAWDDHLLSSPTGTYEIFNNYIAGNSSLDFGGGISMYKIKDHLLVYGNRIEGNFARISGGGAYFADTGPVDLYGNTLELNYSQGSGGGISFVALADDIAQVQVFNNVLRGNYADEVTSDVARGGALSFKDTFDATVFNNTIIDNVAAGGPNPIGGAIDLDRNGPEYDGGLLAARNVQPGFNDPRFFNNIITGNAGMTYTQPGGTVNTTVPVMWGENHAASASNFHVDNPALQGEGNSHLNSESLTRVEYSIIAGGEYATRPGILDGTPQFTDAANGDYSLLSGSLGVDAGVSHMIPRDTLDLDGDGCTIERLPVDYALLPRFSDDPSSPNSGCGQATPVDTGALESSAGIPSGSVIYGDINGNGMVNIDDLVSVLNAFGSCGDCCPSDINGNGMVNIDDLVGMLNSYGATCP